MTGIERSDILSRGSLDRQRQKILIVDDAETNLMILSNLLAEEGEIISATDGVQAIALAESDLPDLILLDVSMPGMDGYEVCRRLKSDIRTRDIPIVFVTGRTEDNDQEKGLSLGAIDYILKPYSPLIVLARIRNHLALQKAHRDLKAANAELTRLATTDFLTGVWNRRRFMELGEAEVARVRRSGRSFGMAMMDVDHFKSVNDTHGHDAGDNVLRALAEACVDRLRNVDIVGRMGGEEFALILPETDPQGAMLTVERLREYLSELAIPIDSGTLTVTVSIGVTTVRDPSDTIEGALKRADEALYKAKGSGRNRTVAYENM
ncbi:MAG TPA: diguanylate cyclase response regulator [Rhodospirillaceae bacterium]|nr:diguanylate cyclase response regulator [Magnetovibrio sp.]HCS70162.1 diguanylate cyclase response regulator [Rhodospirillaceae bacterium]|tara:strand:+ start:444 stop:1406 length:963 start_codon:yes stop_codon:yes gene_type:complete